MHTTNHYPSSKKNWSSHTVVFILLELHVFCELYLGYSELLGWKEPRCPSKEKWIHQVWYIYTMDYYSAIKKGEFMKFLVKWMELVNIILSEVTQSQKNTHVPEWVYQFSIPPAMVECSSFFTSSPTTALPWVSDLSHSERFSGV